MVFCHRTDNENSDTHRLFCTSSAPRPKPYINHRVLMKLIPYQYTEIIFIIHLSICHGLLFICDWWHIEHFMDRYFLKWLPGNLIFKIIYFRLRWYKMPKFEEMKQMYSVYGYMHKIHVFWFPWNIITSILVSYYIHVHLFIEK